MKCEQIRLVLAVSSREWSAAERAHVEAHMAACPSCTTLAQAYAVQERRIAALPRAILSPARQETVLAQGQRDAGWVRWRVRLSNALGTTAAALLILSLALALSALLQHPPAPVALSTATAGPSTPVPTPQPVATSQATRIAVEPDTVPLILVDNGPRSGLGPTEPFSRPDLYAVLAEGNYQVRYRLAERGVQPEPGLGIESPPITAEELADVDLLLVPWTSCYAAGGGLDGGSTVYDFNLTPEEAQTIRAFVASGGHALFILDPTYECDFATLSILGIQADASQAITWNDDTFHTAAGRLNRRSFILAAQYRFQPVHALSGESWAQLAGQSALAVGEIGRGRVAVLGLPLLVNGMPFVSDVADEGQPAPLFAADNLAFLVAVVEDLTGAASGLDVEAIVWEEQRGAQQLSAEQLVTRLDSWTEQRIAWAAPNDDQRRALSDEVTALRTRLQQAVDLWTGPDDDLDPAHYQAFRAILAEVLAGANRLDEVYGPLASESWEARQARRLQPWLLAFLGGGVLLGAIAWRVRRLDVTPAVLARQGAALLPYGVAGLLLLVHLLAATDMVGFGLRAGGYPLNRWGVWSYATTAALAATAFFLPGRWSVSSLTRLALPLLSALALMQAHLLTDLAGAEYATYGDHEEMITLMASLLTALAFCLAGVFYRRPRWLAALAGVHLALALGVMGGSSLLYALREGFEPWQVYQPLLPPSPLPYLVIVYSLGLLAARPARQRVYWGALAVLLGLFVAGGTLLFSHDYTWMDSSAPAVFDWLTNLLLIPLLLTVGILSTAYLWHHRRAASGLVSLVSPLAATVLLLGLAALLTLTLLAPDGLPVSGAAMPWRGANYRVPPGAWTLLLPVARVLAALAPWLVLLSVTLQTWQLLSRSLPVAPLLPRTRRRLWLLALSYGGLLLAAVVADFAAVLQRGISFEGAWGSRQIMVLGGIVSSATVVGLTAWLGRRSGAGRWGGVVYGLALAVQIPTWMLGLMRLRPLSSISILLSCLQGMPLSSAWDLVVPGLAVLTLAALAWHLAVAARALLRMDKSDRPT